MMEIKKHNQIIIQIYLESVILEVISDPPKKKSFSATNLFKKKKMEMEGKSDKVVGTRKIQRSHSGAKADQNYEECTRGKS